MKHTFYALVKVELETELEEKEALEHFEQECRYNFEDTEEVTIMETEWLGTSTHLNSIDL